MKPRSLMTRGLIQSTRILIDGWDKLTTVTFPAGSEGAVKCAGDDSVRLAQAMKVGAKLQYVKETVPFAWKAAWR